MKTVAALALVTLISVAPQSSTAQSIRGRRLIRRRGQDYALFTASSQYTPVSNPSVAPMISFDYSYSNQPGTKAYSSTMQVPSASGYQHSWFFGAEFGRVNGISGLLLIGYNRAPSRDTFRSEFSVSYNFKLGDHLVLHPSIGWSLITDELDFPVTIDNMNKDLVIQGNTFPYHYTYTVKSKRYDVYSDKTHVGIQNDKNGMILQCELRNNPMHRLVVGVTFGYAFYAKAKTQILIGNGAKNVYFDYTAFNFNSSIAPEKIFNYDGFFTKFSLSYCFVRDKVRKKHRIQFY